MKERLKQLAQQAWAQSTADFDGSTTLYAEKFAELIVKECVRILREREEEMFRQSSNPICQTRSDECHIMADEIELQFGIKQ